MSDASDPAELLLVDDADGVRTITINRPEVKNALTAGMRARFSELVDAADADPGTRAIIVTAVDPVFSAGVDFKEVAAGTGVRVAANPGATLRAAINDLGRAYGIERLIA